MRNGSEKEMLCDSGLLERSDNIAKGDELRRPTLLHLAKFVLNVRPQLVVLVELLQEPLVRCWHRSAGGILRAAEGALLQALCK